MKQTTTSTTGGMAASGMSVGGTRAPLATGAKRSSALPGGAKNKLPPNTYSTKAKMTTSQMLEAENKKMEEKLKVVQDMMNVEKQKRSSQGMRGAPSSTTASTASTSQDASKMWRSSTQSSNHAKQVLESHRKALATGMKPSMPGANASVRQGATGRPGPAQSGNPFTQGIAPQNPTGKAAASNIANAINQQAAEEKNEAGQGTVTGTATGNDIDGLGDFPEVNTFLSSIALKQLINPPPPSIREQHLLKQPGHRMPDT